MNFGTNHKNGKDFDRKDLIKGECLRTPVTQTQTTTSRQAVHSAGWCLSLTLGPAGLSKKEPVRGGGLQDQVGQVELQGTPHLLHLGPVQVSLQG